VQGTTTTVLIPVLLQRRRRRRRRRRNRGRRLTNCCSLLPELTYFILSRMAELAELQRRMMIRG
jgi:hypothetical protein